MATVHDYTNEPVTQKIGGREVSIRRLGPLEMLSFAQKRLREIRLAKRRADREQQIAEAREVLDQLNPTKDERLALMRDLVKSPSIPEATEQDCFEWMGTLGGTLEVVCQAARKAGDTLTVDDLRELIDQDESILDDLYEAATGDATEEQESAGAGDGVPLAETP